MNEVGKLTFRTKTGTCTITPEQIILTREGMRSAAAEQVVGNSMGRTLLLYSLFGGAALAFGLWSFYTGTVVPGVVLSLLAAFLMWNVFASRNNSAAGAISRAAIRAVEAHPPYSPFTRGYFIELFLESGRERKRIIMLPGVMASGREESQGAEAAMRASGLLSTK